MKLFLLLLLTSSYAFSTNCNIKFSGFSGKMRSGEKRLNKMIKRKLKKKGYTFFSSKDYTYEFDIAEVTICVDDEGDSSIFSKYPYGFDGDFKNIQSGESIDVSDIQNFGLLGELTNFKFRRMVKKALKKIPHCKN
ncbi:hypothetical protein N9N67_03895 [Bacteriovoracaceae bacterium]|nr:hypothetical protein [Bacteriovoracaceae bacterium]